MHLSGNDLILAATDLSGFLACPHLTTQSQTASLGGPKPPKFPDPAAEVIRARGHEHEARVLAGLRAEGLRVVEIPDGRPATGPAADPPADDGPPADPATAPTDDDRAARWRARADATLEAMRAGADVIYQGCLFDGRWLGLPDFLRRVERPSALGGWSYEVVDAKLSREAKAGAVLQITLYSDLLGRAQGAEPEHMHLALGGPAAPLEGFRFTDFAAYYRSVRARLLQAVEQHAPDATYPEPSDHCVVCDWKSECRKRWVADDHLSLVAGITRKARQQLVERDVPTLAALGRLPLPFRPRLEAVSDGALERVREQARIQLEGREADRPRYELFTDVPAGSGLRRLPAPSPGDLFFDIEGDPHAFDDGIEYLFGTCEPDLAFTGIWALDRAEEKSMFERFIDGVTARLQRHPDMHIYHFGHYERTALQRLMGRHATREEDVDRLLRGGVLVDLHRVVTQSLRASVESYSIKKLEPLYDFRREVDLRAASSALGHFEAWLALGRSDREESELLSEIEGYNRDDCISTARLRDWLEERRAELEGMTGAPVPRPDPPDPDPPDDQQEELDRVAELVCRLTQGVPADPDARSDAEQARWLLAQLLGFHRREDKSYWWQFFAWLDATAEELTEDRKSLAELEYEGVVDTVKQSHVHRYRFPKQEHGFDVGDSVVDPVTERARRAGEAEKAPSPGTVHAVDDAHGTIDLRRAKRSDAPHPAALIPNDYVNPRPMRESLIRLAESVLEHGLYGAPGRAAVALLMREPPRAGQPEGAALRGEGEDTLAAGRRLALALDGTVLPIQGPPGSGKTYLGARMILSLIRRGKTVGVTANSHKVIVNLLDEVCAAARAEGIRLRGVQKASEENGCAAPEIACTESNAEVERLVGEGEVDLVAGTSWLWAREEMAGSVDALVVDEAGQISLANVLAASAAAGSVILLGDPQQLDQPIKGDHPPGVGVSALEHLARGALTLPGDRGLFLDRTWRLHPDVCRFTSEVFYEGRLQPMEGEGLEDQRIGGTDALPPTGLVVVPVAHTGNANESAEEVRAVRALVDRLLGGGATWTDRRGVEKRLALDDVLVVAPYNAQVGALAAGLPEGTRVGTVDKFQGQEAPIVIYSPASSSAEDAPRGMEFLFSPNRLNVATSRARCVAVMVGEPALYAPVCRSVRQMRLANGVCRFGELGAQNSTR
jgi:uncharacterized protein